MFKIGFIALVFGVLGWCADSAYRSIEERKFVYGTHFLFFSPVYAIGGLILVFLYEKLQVPAASQIVAAALALTALEFFAGIFSEKVMGRRYWDYSGTRFNFCGHVNLLHTFYWLIIAAVFKIMTVQWPIIL